MITLYTAPTPNGRKISVTLEELKIPYQIKEVDLTQNQQKSPDFLALNPNGRIPVIVDTANENFCVFESGAIMLYLAEQAGQLLPPSPKGKSLVTQWLMFQMSGLGPMMGQANVFYRYFPEKIPVVINRYQTESLRLLTVLDNALENKEFLLDEYSIADIANFCWAKTHRWSGINIDHLPHLNRWIDTISKRPAVIAGLNVPENITKESLILAGKNIITP